MVIIIVRKEKKIPKGVENLAYPNILNVGI